MEAEKELTKLTGSKIALEDIQLNSGILHYAKSGRGKPLLLLHGLNIGWGQWYLNIKDLNKKFTVFAVDLPGCGHSTASPKALDIESRYVAPLAEFITKLKLQDSLIVAHSASAAVGIKLALIKRLRVRKLVLVHPLGFRSSLPHSQKIIGITPLVKLLTKTLMYPSVKNIHKFLSSAFYDKSKLLPVFTNYFYQAVKRKNTVHPLLFMNSLTKGFRFKPELIINKDDLQKLNLPILIILGEIESLITRDLEETLSDVKQLKVKTIQKTKHVSFIEKAKIFNTMILDMRI